MNKERDKNNRKRSASPVTRQQPLDNQFLEDNDANMNSKYEEIADKKQIFDERYFANNSEKIKTPLKMI